jgi:hypothetical protein
MFEDGNQMSFKDLENILIKDNKAEEGYCANIMVPTIKE